MKFIGVRDKNIDSTASLSKSNPHTLNPTSQVRSWHSLIPQPLHWLNRILMSRQKPHSERILNITEPPTEIPITFEMPKYAPALLSQSDCSSYCKHTGVRSRCNLRANTLQPPNILLHHLIRLRPETRRASARVEIAVDGCLDHECHGGDGGLNGDVSF